MAMTFDGPNLRIILEAGVTTLDSQDMYSRWKDFVKTGDNAKFPLAFRTFGGDPLVSPLEAAPYFIFQNQNGWRIRPPEEDINITLTGNLSPEDDTLGALGIVVPTIGAFTTLIIGIQPVTQVVQSGVSGLTAPESTQLFALGTPAQIWQRVLESSLTMEEALRICLSVLAGKANAIQSPSLQVTYRDIADGKDRVIVVHSTDGDRTQVTLDGS